MTETLSLDAARATGIAALEAAGATSSVARAQVELLLEAEMRGLPSHGFLRLARLIDRIQNGVADPRTTGVHVWRHTGLLEVDGERGLGPAVALSALDAIQTRARETGIAAAVVRNSNHIGMLAYYAEQVARAGQIAIVLSTSEALVHPWGGRRAMLGTNPIAIGVPASPHPFVLDMATSLVPMGKIHDYANRQQPLGAGWALDIDGEPTLDANAAKQGAIAPFGDAKGYALGLAFEVLVAALTASALGTDVKGTLDDDQICNKGDVFIVAETAGHGIAAAITAYLDAVRACPPSQAGQPVVVPGDRSQAQRARAAQSGITIPHAVWARIVALSQHANTSST